MDAGQNTQPTRAKAGAEQRRTREQQLAGWRANAEMLTPDELQSLRRKAKERSAFYRKAFAHLRPGAA